MDYKKEYDLWLNNKHLTNDEINELKQLNNNEIKESFYKNITFGTGGLRGLMGLGTNRINKYTIRWVTTGLGEYLKVNNLNDGVVIAYDNRLNSQKYAYEAAKVLASLNIKAYIFKELRPTPLLSFAVRELKASAGIMLTASHNPKEYNGFKVYNSEGAQIIDEEAHEVYANIKKFEIPFELNYKNEHLITELDEAIENNYYKELSKILINNIKDKKVKMVYSPLHGTGMTMIPKALEKEGYNLYYVDSQVKADPNFTNALSTNPEEIKAYDEAIKKAKAVNADILMVTDPDADRIGLAEKDNENYYIFNGNELAVMMTYYIINEKKPTEGSVYKTIVTSDLITKIAEDHNLNVVEVLTGFKYIGYWTERLDSPYIFGSEESYGSLVKDFVRDKDAVQAAYLMAEMAETLYSRGLTFKNYMQEINELYGYYEELTHQITLLGIEGEKTIKKVMDKARKGYFNKLFYDTISIEDFIEGKRFDDGFYLPPSNVIKIRSNDFWIAFRPSGTEPKLKVYFSVFKKTKQQAINKLEEIKNIILENIEDEV